ncbi:MAG: 2-C-methyl-D-erythritol 4-phosphate cytidylyltransferase [Flavobacteriales bacterium]
MRAAIIVAGGMGLRMGGSIPKQFMLLRRRPVLCWSVEAFHAFDAAMPIIVVLPEQQIPIWRTLCIGHNFQVPHEVVAGGEERSHSVREGLKRITGDPIVAVHDGVRPLVSNDLIARCFAAADEYGSAIPVLPLSSSVREVDGAASKAIDRSRLRTVQTPQCFRATALRKAFELPYDASFTDEATLVERIGEQVHLVEGDERNIKVTTPMDLRVAEAILD